MMKKNIIFYILLPFIFFLSCKNSYEKNILPKEYDFIVVKYEDSLLKTPVDSFYIKNTDTVFSKKKFKIDGFFKIFDSGRNSYFLGKLKVDKKIGKWIFYQKYLDHWVKSEEKNYNNKGLLEGQLVEYDITTGKKLSQNNYINDEEVGGQKYFYPSGKLHIEYEKDKSSAFINNYIVYSTDGEIIYKTDLGKDGTGYIKFYDKDNNIEWEGAFVNKQKQGLHKQYLLAANDEEISETDKILYKNDSILVHTKIFNDPMTDPKLNTEIDSIVSVSAYNNQLKVFYYNNGKVIKKQKVKN